MMRAGLAWCLATALAVSSTAVAQEPPRRGLSARETNPDAEVLYTSVTVNGGQRGVIVTRPKSAGRFPAVLIIGGLGCYSLDGELNRDSAYGEFLRTLTRRHYVTMRVEKSGEGTSQGPLCTDPRSTAKLEAQGYIEGLRLLKSYGFVDAQHVFIFSHSLGPLLAALAVPRETVAGVIAVETIGRSWLEYMLENTRRQFALVGKPLDEVDDAVRRTELCAHDFFVLKKTPAEVEAGRPACKQMIDSFAGVPYTYMQQIGDINLARQWKSADVPVLVIYGTSDPATSADESRYLVEIINSFHPGRATYLEFPQMGHSLKRYESQREFLKPSQPRDKYPIDEDVITAMVKWLDGHR